MLNIENETPEEFQQRKFEGVFYTKEYTNVDHTEYQIWFQKEDIKHTISPQQDLYQEWLSLGNMPLEVDYQTPTYPYGLENLDSKSRVQKVIMDRLKNEYDINTLDVLVMLGRTTSAIQNGVGVDEDILKKYEIWTTINTEVLLQEKKYLGE